MRFVFLLVFFVASVPLALPFDGLTVFELRTKFLELHRQLTETWMTIENNVVSSKSQVSQKRRIFIELDTVNDQIADMNSKILGIGMLENLPREARKEFDFDKMREACTYLDQYYADMEKYIRSFEKYDNSTLIDFANNVVSHRPNSVVSLMKSNYLYVTDQRFLKVVDKSLRTTTNSSFCYMKQSSSQVFFNFLNEITWLHTKAFVTIQAAYMIKKLYYKGTFAQEIQSNNEEYKNYTNYLVSKIRPYVTKASTELWRCDPEKHIEGETYIQITNFLHGLILNKVNLDPNGGCRDECDVFSYTKTQKCDGNEWCEKQTTCPKIVNCMYVDYSMDVCSTKMHKTNRRYEYITFDNGRRNFGEKKTCKKSDMSQLTTYHSWVILRCSYCFCLCDEGPKYFSERYINLRLAKANITDNKVVTGVRFVKHNKIIHLQVQEGKLLPFGQIEKGSVEWVPVENYKTTDSDIYDGQDFFTLSWEQRGFNLIDIKVKEGQVVAGVRFTLVGKRLHLQVLSVPFNFTSGQLNQHLYSLQKGPRNKYKFMTEVKLNNPNVPTRSSSSNEITTNKYVQFTNSGYEEDAGQTTVPFFDAQPVESATPVPLSGVGVFHKTKRGYGGFIAPKIFTYNFGKHLGPVFPKN